MSGSCAGLPRECSAGWPRCPGTNGTGRADSSGPSIGTVRHVFTHFSLDLDVVRRFDPVGEGWWHPLDRLDEAGLPTLYRRAAELALAATEAARAAA